MVTRANKASWVIESPLVDDPSSSVESIMVSLGWSRCQARPAVVQMIAKTNIPQVIAKIGDFFVEHIVWELLRLIHSSFIHRHIHILNLFEENKMLVAVCHEFGSYWQSLSFPHQQIPLSCGKLCLVQMKPWSNQFNLCHQVAIWERNEKVERHPFFAAVSDHQI